MDIQNFSTQKSFHTCVDICSFGLTYIHLFSGHPQFLSNYLITYSGRHLHFCHMYVHTYIFSGHPQFDTLAGICIFVICTYIHTYLVGIHNLSQSLFGIHNFLFLYISLVYICVYHHLYLMITIYISISIHLLFNTTLHIPVRDNVEIHYTRVWASNNNKQ